VVMDRVHRQLLLGLIIAIAAATKILRILAMVVQQ
jgi:hypothetical protein